MLNIKNSRLKKSRLVKNSSFVNGQWLGSSEQFDVMNPANEKIIASIDEVTSSQLELAITSASAALAVWQSLSASERGSRLNQWQQLLRNNLDDLARILVLEQGKPLVEAKGEILHAADYLKLYADISINLEPSSEIAAEPHQHAQVIKRPIGVVTAITPWNFPCAMVLRKAGAALAAGCCVVLKPSELTPLTALALAQLSVDAAIPAGVFNVVVGSNAQAIGEILTQHEKVAKFSFTGSTKIGKKLLQQCSSGVKRTAMELGGNAPFIVFDDADLNTAVEGAMFNKFRNAGQTCVTANRFLIHENIVDEFKRRLLEKIKSLNLGGGLNPSTHMGPLITSAAIDKIIGLIDEATNLGAVVLVGGGKVEGAGTFFQPTLVDKVEPSMAIFKREIFGPVFSITTFDSDSQAIKLANQTEFGLCGYLYSQNHDRINAVSQKLEVGMLGVNEARLSNPSAPFGGIKQSGMGREGGHYGIEEYLYYQYVCQRKPANSTDFSRLKSSSSKTCTET